MPTSPKDVGKPKLSKKQQDMVSDIVEYIDGCLQIIDPSSSTYGVSLKSTFIEWIRDYPEVKVEVIRLYLEVGWKRCYFTSNNGTFNLDRV